MSDITPTLINAIQVGDEKTRKHYLSQLQAFLHQHKALQTEIKDLSKEEDSWTDKMGNLSLLIIGLICGILTQLLTFCS